MVRDVDIGRVEATRQPVIAMIDRAPAAQAHPAFWCPFVVVGEGRYRQRWVARRSIPEAEVVVAVLGDEESVAGSVRPVGDRIKE